MFRHLDDPAPPVPDAERLAAVLRRSARLRARRRRQRMAGAAVLALCATLLATTLVTTHAIGRPIPSRETAYQFDQAANPLPVGTPVPTTALTDVVFIDAGDGFALAAHRGMLVLATSTDGGADWHVVDGRLPVGPLGTTGAVQMEFAGPDDGYLWQGATPGTAGAPMWISTDGGRTFTRAPLGPVVYDVSAVGTDVWALVGSCPMNVLGPACTLEVRASTDAGRTWHPAPGAVPASLGTTALPGNVELARVTPERAYVLSLVPGGPATLAFTADGAATWTTRPVPCSSPVDLGAELALSSTRDLWLVCGGQATGGAQAKALYRSSTGGTSWSLTAQTAPFAGSAAPTTGTGSLPLGGYVAPYSIGHKNLDVTTATSAWLFPSRGSVVATIDGGTSWKAVPSLANSDFGSGAPGNMTFISAANGWITQFGTGLWRTTDGTTWQALGT